jgi:tetratricopeptide (TPR) repeat protein
MTMSRLLTPLLLGVAAAVIASACSDPEVAKARHMEKADRHMANQEYQQAILEYRNALKAVPRDGEGRFKLAEAYLKVGRPMEAAREYVRAADLLPDRADIQIKAGSVLLSAREFDRAKRAGEMAVKADPKNVEAQLLLAHALAGLKDLPAAIQEIEEAIQLAPEDSRPYTSLGSMRLAEGDRARAEEAYLRAVELDPKSAAGHLALGMFYWSGNARDRAEAKFTEAASLDPKNLLVNRALALFYLTDGRAADAEAPLLRLAELEDAGGILTVADHYARTGRTEEARAMYSRLKSREATRTTAVLRLARLDYDTGNRPQAHAALDEELKVPGAAPEVAVLKAQLLLSDGKLPEAEAQAKSAVETNPNLASAHYVLGLAQMARDRREAATRSFNETLRINPKAAAAELQLSRLSLAAGNTDDALRLAENARKAAPGNLDARLGVARALLGRRDLARAEAELKALRTDYPKQADVHALYGGLLAARSNFAGAAREYDRALELDPSNLPALGGRIQADLRAKRPGDARARLARAIKADPENGSVLVLGGRLEATLGDTAAAEQHFRRALTVNPALLDAYFLLGQLFVQQNRLDEARTEFERLAGLSAEAVVPKTMVGMIYEMQNRPQDARRAYEEILNTTSRAPVAANNLAWLYAESGEKLDTALELAQSAKQQLPDRHEVDDTLGWVYFKRNMPELAIAPLERAVKADTANPQYHAHLGLAYARAGRADEAKRSLARALELRPDFPGAEEARKTLASLGQ